MLADSVPSPFNSIWVKLSISLAEAACSILLLFALYKLLGKCCPISSISYQRQVQNSINTENIETGVPFKLLQSVCAVKFSTEEMKRGDCAICLEEFGEGEWLRVLPNCLHSFHIHCIDMWLSAHSDCPMCRKQVMGDLDESCSCIQIPLEALPREDVLRRVRPPDYYLVESEAIRNEAIRSDWRGIQSLMGL